MRELTPYEILLVSGGVSGDTVLVIGPGGGVAWNGFNPGGYTGSDYSGSSGGGANTPDESILIAEREMDIAKGIEVDTTNLTGATALQASALTFLRDTVIPKMNELVKTAKFNDSFVSLDNNNAPIFTGGEVSSNWAVTDIVVVAHSNFDNNGGVGRTIFDHVTGNVTLEINVDALVNYMGSVGTNGLLYPSLDKALSYLAHEQAHATGMGVSQNRNMYLPNSDGGTARTAQEFQQNEQFAWGGSKAILEMAGYSSNFQPNEGAEPLKVHRFGISG